MQRFTRNWFCNENGPKSDTNGLNFTFGKSKEFVGQLCMCVDNVRKGWKRGAADCNTESDKWYVS